MGKETAITPENGFDSRRPRDVERLLVDALIECLVDLGYSGTTIAAACRRAGVSPASFRHRFGTKSQAFLVVVDYLTAKRERDLRWTASQLEADEDRVGAVIELLWAGFTSRLFGAAIELWVAARSDERLWLALRQVERALARRNRQMVAEMVDLDQYPNLDRALEQVTYLMRGAAVADLLRSEPDPDRTAASLAIWRDLFETLAAR